MKLSKRLAQINQMVLPGYDHIWDCCCDHGFLGASLLNRQAAKHIHFVDIVPKLVSEVERKLIRFYANSEAHWSTHCIDVATLPLTEYSGKQLIIIAGVGGDLMQHFITALHEQNPNLKLDFLLCPVHHQFNLRQMLNQLNFGLKEEVLLEENGRFYEILYVSTHKQQDMPIALTGTQIWHANSAEQSAAINHYLTATLNHYHRIQQGDSVNVQHIIDEYSKIYRSLLCSE